MTDDFETLKLYKQYLNTLQNILNSYFEGQKEYICCQKGCAKCCETGQYPYSEIEFKYLATGFYLLEHKKQVELVNKIKKIKSDYELAKNKKSFMYRCPFLDNDRTCILYDYRGLICRTFGLIQRDKDNKVTLPFCSKSGLNYSKVYDPKSKKINYDLVKKENYKALPTEYKIGLGYLTSKEIFENEAFDFGEIKPLIEWL